MNYENIVNKEFYDINKETLECSICSDILKSPIMCNKCEQIFCKECIDQLAKNEDNQSNYDFQDDEYSDVRNCPHCNEDYGFTSKGLNPILRQLDKLQFNCDKCSGVHTYSSISKCTSFKCGSCEEYYDYKVKHYCYICWRCDKGQDDLNTMNEHLENCKSKSDYKLEITIKNVNKTLGDIWSALEKMIGKLIFIFDYINMSIKYPSSERLSNVYNRYFSVKEEIDNEKKNVGFVNDMVENKRIESIRKLDIKVFYSNNLIEIFDYNNNNDNMIGEFDIDYKVDSDGIDQSIIIENTIYSKDKGCDLHIVNLMRPNTYKTKDLKNKDDQALFLHNLAATLKLEDHKRLVTFVQSIWE